jgi:hypothetical protein
VSYMVVILSLLGFLCLYHCIYMVAVVIFVDIRCYFRIKDHASFFFLIFFLG